MIYALNTKDVSAHERRGIARRIRDGQTDILAQDERIVHVCDTRVGEKYLCVYCFKTVRKWWKLERVRFDHDKNDGCLGSDKGLPGITNPNSVTAICPES